MNYYFNTTRNMHLIIFYAGIVDPGGLDPDPTIDKKLNLDPTVKKAGLGSNPRKNNPVLDPN